VSAATLRIGQVADELGVSCRTVRYYEQLGLVKPSAHTKGGERRYSTDDVERLRRIRQLQELMGFGLDEIRQILIAEDRLDKVRSEYLAGTSPKRRRELVDEAIEINDTLRASVRKTLQRTQAFLAELEDKAQRYRATRASMTSSAKTGKGVQPSGKTRAGGRRT
jgi:DNA-binding transcriptional MerR regulator